MTIYKATYLGTKIEYIDNVMYLKNVSMIKPVDVYLYDDWKVYLYQTKINAPMNSEIVFSIDDEKNVNIMAIGGNR